MPNPYFSTSGNMDDTLMDAIMQDVPTQQSPLINLGSTGLKRAAGIVDEEFLPALRGRKAIKVFQEMSLNDPIVGALLFSITQLLRQVEWRVETPDNSSDSAKAKEFIEQCMDDMSHPWSEMIADILSCLIYGWSWNEIVYKKRVGPWEKDPKKRSKYDDGMFGWRKIQIRSQETLLRWVFDEDGGIKAMVQLAPPDYQTVIIPIERSLLFRTNTAKGNPEGLSMLRNAYRPWFYKKRMEEIEAVGVERDLAGMPVARVPAYYMDAPEGSKEKKVFEAYKRMVAGVRRDEHEGLVLPVQYDRNTKQPLFDFELMSSGGTRTFDTNTVIGRYEQRILMTVLADFILVGHEGTGSYSLHVDKTGIFRSALNTMAQMIADVFNRYAIPRLFDLNGWRPKELPEIVPSDVDPPDLTQLAQFMTAMGGLGMEFFPNADLEEFLLGVARLPKMPDDQLEMRRQMSEQYQDMSYAEQQMQYLGMQQKAQMVEEGGYSPDQADQQQMNPNEEQVAQQTQQQVDAQGAMGEQQVAQQADPRMQAMAERDHARQGEQMQREDQMKDKDAQRQLSLKDRDDKSKDADVKRQAELKDREDKSKETDHKRAKELTEVQEKAKAKDFQRKKAEAAKPKVTVKRKPSSDKK